MENVKSNRHTRRAFRRPVTVARADLTCQFVQVGYDNIRFDVRFRPGAVAGSYPSPEDPAGRER